MFVDINSDWDEISEPKSIFKGSGSLSSFRISWKGQNHQESTRKQYSFICASAITGSTYFFEVIYYIMISICYLQSTDEWLCFKDWWKPHSKLLNLSKRKSSITIIILCLNKVVYVCNWICCLLNKLSLPHHNNNPTINFIRSYSRKGENQYNISSLLPMLLVAIYKPDWIQQVKPWTTIDYGSWFCPGSNILKQLNQNLQVSCRFNLRFGIKKVAYKLQVKMEWR